MKHQLAALLALISIFSNAAFAGKLQNQDFKSLSELTSAGATSSSLLNTNKIYDLGTSQQLSTAFSSSIVGTLMGETKLNLSADVSNLLPVANGGTGASTLTLNSVLLGNGTSAPLAVAPGTVGNVLTSDGTIWKSAISSGSGAAKNYLINGGFENTPFLSSWAFTNSTASLETTQVIENLQAAKLVLAAQSGDLAIQSVTPALQLAGQNMQASCRVQTTLSTIQVCALAGGIEQACQSVSSSGVYSQVIVNFAGPASGSVGVKVKATASSTGTVYLDDCTTSFATNIGTAAQAVLLGTVTISGCASAWSTGSSSFAAFSAQTGCAYTTSGSAQAPSTNIPGIKFASLPAGDYRLEYSGRFEASVAGIASSAQFTDGTNTARETSNIGSGSSIAVDDISQSLSYTTPQSNATLQVYLKSGGGGSAALYGTAGNPGVIKVWYFPNTAQQVVSPQQADYDWTAYTPTFTGFGTVSGVECLNKRTGSDALIKCKFTSGSATATEARISLPTGLTSADTTKIPSIQSVGTFYRNVGSVGNALTSLIEPSVGYVTVGQVSSSGVPLTKANASSFTGAGEVLFFNARVPIQGWIQTNSAPLLVGSVTSNSLGAERIERATLFNNGSTCGITNQSGSWIASSVRNNVGQCTHTFNAPAFSAPPTCSCSIIGTAGASCDIFSQSSSNVAVFTTNGANTYVDYAVSLICMGPR